MLENYKCAASYCRQNFEGGGVCIFVRENIDYKERQDVSNLSVEFIFEICGIEVACLNLLIIVIYWPNRNRSPDIFFNSLGNLLKLLNTKDSKKNILIGGDFNINILENTNQTKTLLNLMYSFNFEQLVKNPTRITSTSSTCIDLLFSNFPDCKNEIVLKDYGFSDHIGVLCPIARNPAKYKETWYIEKRLYREENIENFKNELQTINWTQLLYKDNINDNYDIFHTQVQNILNKNIPKQKQKIKTQSKIKNGWISTGLKISCKHKRLLKLLTLQTKCPILHNHYKKYEKLLKQAILKSRKIYYANKMKHSNNMTKSMWQIIKETTNKVPKKSKENIKLKIDGSETENPSKVANYFNDFFANVGGNENSVHGRPVINPTVNSIFIGQVDLYEVRKIILKLKTKHSFGHDDIPPVLVKKCADAFTLPLTILINQSLCEGVVPDHLKITKIKPIHKKGDKLDCNNYRPIALLPTFSKIFETVMTQRLYSFCEKHGILDESQNGFRKNRSTTLAVYKYIQEVLNLINIRKYGVGILLDMSKAYDRVNHKILLNKLYGIGIRGTAHAWFTSYLTNRVQYTVIEYHNHNTGEISNTKSNLLKVKKSIPQGSVLGCILFLIYINDLPKNLNIPCVLFADDISLVLPCCDGLNLNNTLSCVLNSVNSWLIDHNLEINFSKTKLIQFRPHQKAPLKINYSIQNTQINCVENVRLLGLIIDTHLNWKSHILNISNKLARFTYALNELKKSTDLNTAKSTYYAYAHSCLQYGILLWGNSVDVHKLFILQKKCIRILAHIDSRESCRNYFKQFNILTLTSMYILDCCKFVKKYDNLFEKLKDVSKFTPRYPHKIVLPNSNMAMYGSGPYSMCIKIFNKLPEEIQAEDSFPTFTNKLKSYLLSKCYYSLKEYLN